MMIEAPLTKAAEMELFRQLVAGLPDGYIRDILTEAEPFIDSAIRSDLCSHSPISGLIDRQRELAEEIADARRQLAEVIRDLATARRELAAIDRRREETIAEVRTLARCAGVL